MYIKKSLLFAGSVLLGMLSVVQAAPPLTVNHQYQINGPHAQSGLVSDGDTISYTMNYSGVNVGYEGDPMGGYFTTISTGGCFTNLSGANYNSNILYFSEVPDFMNFNPNLITNVLDCNVKAMLLNIRQGGNSTFVNSGTNPYWNSLINENGQAIYLNPDANNNSNDLYFWNGSSSTLVDSGTNAQWYTLNQNGMATYYKSDSVYDLYFWNGSSSTFVASELNAYWAGLNANGVATYYTINSNNEYAAYLRDGDSSTFIASGATWAGLNANGVATYTKYVNSGVAELYILNGNSSTLIDTGVGATWSSLNDDGIATYYKYNSGNTELYIRDGNSSTLVGSGLNAYWSSLNQNGIATYIQPTGGDQELYIRDGSSSTLVATSSGNMSQWNSLNDDGIATYYKSNSGNYELYFWDGNSSTLVATSTAAEWTSLNNNGMATYYKLNDGNGNFELYIRDGSSSNLIDTGPYISLNKFNNDGTISYMKTNGNGNYEAYIRDGTSNIAVGSGLNVFWGYLNQDSVGTYLQDDGNGNKELYIWNPHGISVGTFTYDIMVQSGVTASGLQSIVLSGGYGENPAVLTPFSSTHMIYYPSVTPPNNGGGGGGGGSIAVDTCPNGDYSTSYYDGNCGTAPTTTGTTVTYTDEELYNSTIPNGYCYTRETSSILDSKNITTSDEFKKALTFMYSYKMTMFKNVTQFDPYASLTRQQAAKLFSNFATNILCRQANMELKANYNDIADADPTLIHYINLAYELGLMKGGDNGNFRPFDTITKAEFNAVIVRMLLNAYLPENDGTHRYDTYNRVSTDLGIIKQGAGEVPVIRNDASLMLFRAYKNQQFSEINKSFLLESADKFIP